MSHPLSKSCLIRKLLITISHRFSTTTTTLPPLAGRNAADSGPTDHRIAAAITIAARQQTVSAVSIPKYASACSGAARYSSACSCIGVTRMTTTVGAPITLSTSISTIFITPTVLQTQTQTQTVSTTVVVTSTAPACAFSSFYLQAQGSSVDGRMSPFLLLTFILYKEQAARLPRHASRTCLMALMLRLPCKAHY